MISNFIMAKTAIIEQIKHQYFVNWVCVSSENHYEIRFWIGNDDMGAFCEYLDSIDCFYSFDKETKKQVWINTTKYCRCELMSNWLLNNWYSQALPIDWWKSIKFISYW